MSNKQPSERAVAAAVSFMGAADFAVATDLNDDEPCHVIMEDYEFVAFLDEQFAAHDELLASIKELREAILDASYTTERCRRALHKSDAVLALAEPEKPE